MVRVKKRQTGRNRDSLNIKARIESRLDAIIARDLGFLTESNKFRREIEQMRWRMGGP